MKKFFKPIIFMLALAAAVLSFAGCSKSPQSEIVGKWKYSLNADIRDAITEVLVDPAVYTDFYYEFNEDGTGCTYSSADEDKPVDFTYTYDGKILTITMQGKSISTPCDVEENSMTITEYGETTVFNRE